MFSIVIPVYNEAQNLKSLVEQIFNSLKDYDLFEVILVNDASSDNTIEIVEGLKNFHSLILFNNSVNKGQSYSITKGIKESKNEIIITIDGDGQNNPRDIPNLLEYYLQNKNISLVGGIRKKRVDSLIKIVSSIIANKIRSKILDDKCDDTGCSLKVFSRSAFLKLPYFDGIHRFLPALFRGYNFECYYIYVDHRAREKGISKYGTIDRLYKGIIDIIKVRKIIKDYTSKKKYE
jgi:dolichol-phosphate mannosyltransferase